MAEELVGRPEAVNNRKSRRAVIPIGSKKGGTLAPLSGPSAGGEREPEKETDETRLA
jgi:hypothetical protein